MTKGMIVSFEITPADKSAVARIVERAVRLYASHGVKLDKISTEMDLIAAHANGNPLDFHKLEDFDDFNLMHDVTGIYRHLDRETGKIGGFFSPRCSART